jgi:aerobic carbon-monoxide dehydrogenase medium subunit
MLRSFYLEEPQSIGDAVGLLARHGDAARIYAGGTELLLAMKERLISCERLINIKKISSLNHVDLEDSTVCIGALATHHGLEENPVLAQCIPALVAMEREVANVRVRGVGTLGGNLCFAEPHSDPGTLLLALGAKLVSEKLGEKREIPIERFFVGAFETALEPAEMMTEVRIPVPPPQAAATYIKFGYLERPSVGVALYLALNTARTEVMTARIAVGSAGPLPRRVPEAEAILEGVEIKDGAARLVEAGRVAARAAEAVSDLHGPADYKEHLIQVLLQRAFDKVVRQCQGISQ